MGEIQRGTASKGANGEGREDRCKVGSAERVAKSGREEGRKGSKEGGAISDGDQKQQRDHPIGGNGRS
jgi:hypothetical protein